MRNDTRRAFNAHLQNQARLNDVDSANHQFAVEPSVQQTLEERIQESSALLGRVNSVPVDELKGQKVMLGNVGPIAGRTDVNQRERETRAAHTLDGDQYECASTQFDTHIAWATLDSWSRFPNFQRRIQNRIVRQQALDAIMIGFNGTHAAAQTDLATHPMLQDVNKGWLQQYRDNAPTRVMGEGATAGEVTFGAGGDYAHIDALVYDAVKQLVDPWFRDANDMVVMLSRDLLHEKYFPLLNATNEPTERNALDLIMSSKRVGGHQAADVPFFPENSILVTPLDNLSRYWQRGSRRRHIKDKPERMRIENYDSSNDAFVVEDYGRGVLIENVYPVEDAPSAQA